MSGFWREVWDELRGMRPKFDYEDMVPDSVHVTCVTSAVPPIWYITATWGDGDDHHHYEIKLDKQRYRQLCDEIARDIVRDKP